MPRRFQFSLRALLDHPIGGEGENPYRAPKTGRDAFCTVPQRTRGPIQFSLRWIFVFSAGMMTGGQTARLLLLSEPPAPGGGPLSWSVYGEAAFFCIGSVAALGGMAIVTAAPAALRFRSPWRRRNNIRRMGALIAGACIVGALSAALAFLPVAFTMPRDMFDLFTTKK